MIVTNTNNNENKRFTIQYTKEELDKIQNDFLEQINEYIARINNRIIKTIEEIEKEAGVGEEVEQFPPTIKGGEIE